MNTDASKHYSHIRYTAGVLLSMLYIFFLVHTRPVIAAGYEDENIKIRIIPRTANQMLAFYEARGFPVAMLTEIDKACFFTFIIKNKGQDILWHDISSWEFTANGKPLQRYTREYWNTQWSKIDAPVANRSTFRWTLLPEKLDFRPGESEGGNITIPRSDKTFTIKAIFSTGSSAIAPRLTNLKCALDKTQ